MRRALRRMTRFAVAAGTLAAVVGVSAQAAHAGIGLNHCEPVLRSGR
jgi:hypothetical protein